jgi:hypothetical protein
MACRARSTRSEAEIEARSWVALIGTEMDRHRAAVIPAERRTVRDLNNGPLARVSRCALVTTR